MDAASFDADERNNKTKNKTMNDKTEIKKDDIEKVSCKLPMRFIRREFMREAKRSEADTTHMSCPRFAAVWHEGLASLEKRLDSAKTEDELSDVIHSHTRLSLHDWIESL